jgi:hypothetical protein
MIELLLLAQLSQPVQKVGPCPLGYITSGNYCVPLRDSSNAVMKDGNCPVGYFTNGNYCRQYGHN